MIVSTMVERPSPKFFFNFAVFTPVSHSDELPPASSSFKFKENDHNPRDAELGNSGTGVSDCEELKLSVCLLNDGADVLGLSPKMIKFESF